MTLGDFKDWIALLQGLIGPLLGYLVYLVNRAGVITHERLKELEIEVTRLQTAVAVSAARKEELFHRVDRMESLIHALHPPRFEP